jgi:hypothetical protein
MTTTTKDKRAKNVAPPRSHEQRMESLALANRVRSAKAEIRKRVNGGELHARKLLTSKGYQQEHLRDFEIRVLGEVEVGYFLRIFASRFGPEKTRRALLAAKIPEHRKIRRLGVQQRADLDEVLHRFAAACAHWDEREGA